MRSSYRSGEPNGEASWGDGHGVCWAQLGKGYSDRTWGIPKCWLSTKHGLPGVGTCDRHPPVTTPSSSAIDYSDSTMLEAQHLLRAVAAFLEDARAYMKGQLACGPVREDVLWERWVLPGSAQSPGCQAWGCLEGSEAFGDGGPWESWCGRSLRLCGLGHLAHWVRNDEPCLWGGCEGCKQRMCLGGFSRWCLLVCDEQRPLSL